MRTDSTHILAAIRALSRLEILGETLRYALNTIAAVAPNWLAQIVPDPDWYERYGQRIQENRLPSSKQERKTLALRMGTDGIYLLDAIWSESAPEWLRSIEAVEILRQVWIQQFYIESGSIQLREPSNCPPPALYQHLVDAGYIDAQLLVDSKHDYNLDLIGPAPGDSQWQSRAGKGFGLANFDIDWQSEVVRCPQGKSSRVWKERLNLYQQPVIYVSFKKADCQSCPVRSDCTRAKTGVRTLTLRPCSLISSFLNITWSSVKDFVASVAVSRTARSG